MGDFVANAIAVTPEREKRFAFSVSIQTNSTRIVVSAPGFGSFSTLNELGREGNLCQSAHNRLSETSEVERLTAE
jgi:hypothetical protein